MAEPVTTLDRLAHELVVKLMQQGGGNGRHVDPQFDVSDLLQKQHPARLINFNLVANQGRDVEKGGIPGAFSAERLAPKPGEAFLFRTIHPCQGPTQYGGIYYDRDSVELFPPGTDLPIYWRPVSPDIVKVDPAIIGKGTLRRSGNFRVHSDGSQSSTANFHALTAEDGERMRREYIADRRRKKQIENDFGLPIHEKWPE